MNIEALDDHIKKIDTHLYVIGGMMSWKGGNNLNDGIVL